MVMIAAAKRLDFSGTKRSARSCFCSWASLLMAQGLRMLHMVRVICKRVQPPQQLMLTTWWQQSWPSSADLTLVILGFSIYLLRSHDLWLSGLHSLRLLDRFILTESLAELIQKWWIIASSYYHVFILQLFPRGDHSLKPLRGQRWSLLSSFPCLS